MDIETLKKLAGIQPLYTYVEEQNISHTATAIKKKEKQLGLKPGDSEWFKLWFSKPYMTGPAQFRSRKK